MSLVELLVALGIIAAVPVLLISLLGEYFGTMRRFTSTNSIRELEPAVRVYVADLKARYGAQCANPGGAGPINTFMSTMSERDIGTIGRPSLITAPVSVSSVAPADMKAAALRCGNPRLAYAQNVALPALTGNYYFCMMMARTTTDSERQGFLGAITPFIEVRSRVVDLASNTDRSCTEFGSNPVAVLETFYTFYWQSGTPDKPTFHSYRGWYNAMAPN